jgi:uncharacterized protein YjiS (DUF1127 family)
MKMLPAVRSPNLAPKVQSAWLTRLLYRVARARWWMARDESRQALAQVDDDHLSDLSEIGRQVRREERRRLSAIP